VGEESESIWPDGRHMLKQHRPIVKGERSTFSGAARLLSPVRRSTVHGQWVAHQATSSAFKQNARRLQTVDEHCLDRASAALRVRLAYSLGTLLARSALGL